MPAYVRENSSEEGGGERPKRGVYEKGNEINANEEGGKRRGGRWIGGVLRSSWADRTNREELREDGGREQRREGEGEGRGT